MSKIEVARADWTSDRESLLTVRYEVFVVGQKVPVEIEQDELDASCVHFLAQCDNAPIGTARVDNEGHIGRVAVLEAYRGLGVGSRLMRAAVEEVRSKEIEYALLNSQDSAVEFYRRLGFEPYGQEFVEAGISHIAMKLRLQHRN